MTARDWIENSRSLTQSSSIPLGVPVATHIDRLLRDTRRDLRAALDALEKVLEMHHRRAWSVLSGDRMSFAQTEFPDQCDHCRRAYPCPTVTEIKSVLEVSDE